MCMSLPSILRNSWPAAERPPPAVWLIARCDGGGFSRSGTLVGGAFSVVAEADRLLQVRTNAHDAPLNTMWG